MIDEVRCELCNRKCTNLKDKVCCLERNMHPGLYDLEKNVCDECGAQYDLLAKRMEKARKK